MILKRSLFIELFFSVPSIAMCICGVYLIQKGLYLFEFIQFDTLIIGFSLLFMGLLFCYYTLDGSRISLTKSSLIVRNVFGIETKNIKIDNIESKYIRETNQKGVAVREIALLVDDRVHFVSLFGFSKSLNKVENYLRRARNNKDLVKEFAKRDLLVLAYILGITLFGGGSAGAVYSSNENEYLESSRSDVENTKMIEVKVEGYSLSRKRRSKTIRKIEIHCEINSNFDFIVGSEYFSKTEMKIIEKFLKRGTKEMSFMVNGDLFENKIRNVNTSMSSHEKYFSYNEVLVYGIKVNGEEYGILTANQ